MSWKKETRRLEVVNTDIQIDHDQVEKRNPTRKRNPPQRFSISSLVLVLEGEPKAPESMSSKEKEIGVEALKSEIETLSDMRC